MFPNLLISIFQDRGWKGWGEISYGGHECVKRAKAAEFLVGYQALPLTCDGFLLLIGTCDGLIDLTAQNDSH